MKYLVLIMLLLFSSYGKADEYWWCQLTVNVIKEHYKSSAEELINKKSKIATANSVESLTQATGRDYKEMISALSKENVAKEKADVFVTEFMKSFEMSNISLAITLKKLEKDVNKKPDEFLWNEIFDVCVKNSSEKS